jgi:hypothetical protein
MEYLNLLAKCPGWDRDRVVHALANYADDPNSHSGFTFEKLAEGGLYRLRTSIADTVEQASKPNEAAGQ